MKHIDEVLNLLKKQIGNDVEVDDIRLTADEVQKRWVPPLSGGAEETNGLIYGLIQSGKTGVLSATGALGADEGYRTIIILTSDIDPLYDQTLARIQEAFPGIDVISKNDFKDADAFLQRVRVNTCAIVTSKNGQHLKTLAENFKKGNLKGLACLIVDDEADQASLNTKEHKGDGSRSRINDLILELRGFFQKNTYLQVTATPQALFLQTPNHDFRPKFTVLSHPGGDYVGGDDFFGEGSKLVREFDINDILVLAPGSQPRPSFEIPSSLVRALDAFMVAATFKKIRDAEQKSAFLCHVSMRKDDHKHIVDLMRKYKTELTTKLKEKNAGLKERLRAAYQDLSQTHPGLAAENFDNLVEKIEFYSPGITIKLVNGETDEDVATRTTYNLFVGGNKLGRGVTIKNLLVSYYGRHPKTPQADTVLQHARMYGYRRKDIGLLRLFLPRELHMVFKAIHKMETGLRNLIASEPGEGFRGVYVEGQLNPTRKSVLAPGAVGIYAANGTYNPAQVLRGPEVAKFTERIDKKLESIKNRAFVELSIPELAEIIALCQPDQSQSERIWDTEAVSVSIKQLAEIMKQTNGYVYVDRERDLKENRRETQGILTGGEAGAVPADKLTLFILRTAEKRKQSAAWWPQIRFPGGRYAFAFSI